MRKRKQQNERTTTTIKRTRKQNKQTSFAVIDLDW